MLIELLLLAGTSSSLANGKLLGLIVEFSLTNK